MTDMMLQRMTTDGSALGNEGPCLLDLREANERLVVAAMGAQEIEAHAEEAHRRQIKFLAMVAHELRNPLSPIRMVAGMLENAEANTALLTRCKGIIERQVGHMARLIDDLLDGTLVSTGKFRLECNTFDLCDVITQAVEACRPAIDTRHQQLSIELPQRPLSVVGDPGRLAQVFSNLLDNASKYTQEEGTLILSLVRKNDMAVVTISDNGSGMSAEILPHIFELFVQGARAAVSSHGGFGIGLAVVRELVEAHNGSVSGKSAGLGLGSEFVVTLPAR